MIIIYIIKIRLYRNSVLATKFTFFIQKKISSYVDENVLTFPTQSKINLASSILIPSLKEESFKIEFKSEEQATQIELPKWFDKEMSQIITNSKMATQNMKSFIEFEK